MELVACLGSWLVVWVLREGTAVNCVVSSVGHCSLTLILRVGCFVGNIHCLKVHLLAMNQKGWIPGYVLVVLKCNTFRRTVVSFSVMGPSGARVCFRKCFWNNRISLPSRIQESPFLFWAAVWLVSPLERMLLSCLWWISPQGSTWIDLTLL